MTYPVNIGGVTVLFGDFFDTADEADEWLEFDAREEDIEQAAFREPDHFEEWRRWRQRWLDGLDSVR